MMIRLVFSCVVTLFATGALAQVYKCVDSSGRATYSQESCPSGSRSSVITNRIPPATAGLGPTSTAEQEMAFRKRRKEQLEAQKKAAEKEVEAKQAAENCARARAQVVQLNATGRISQYNEKGERYFLNEDQIAEERARANAMVSQWCK